MDYFSYCKNLKLDPADKQSQKMYYWYLEANEASSGIKGMKADSIIIDDIVKKENMNLNCWRNPVGLQMNCAVTTNCVSLAPNYPEVCKTDPKVPSQKKEKNMYVSDDKHIESAKINYLYDRIDGIYYKKMHELDKQFNIIDDEAPQTASELVKRIQDGKFLLKDDTKEKTSYDPIRYVRWRDPSAKEDKEGRKAAGEAYGKASQDARDAVAILDPKEALAEVKKLEAWTFPAGK